MKKNILMLMSFTLIVAVGFLIFRQYEVEQKLEKGLYEVEQKLEKGLAARNNYFATTEDGRLVPMIPLSDPKIRDKALVSMVKKVVLDSFDYNSNDYRLKLKEATKYYTKRGWESLTVALSDHAITDVLKNNGASVTSQVLAEPEIIEKKNKAGRYEWVLKMPVEIQFGGKQIITTLKVMVVRTPMLESPNGVGIENIVFSDVKTE